MCLQYADDTLLILENPRVDLNVKWILTYFEQVSWMRINYHRSALVPINMNEEELSPFLDILRCQVGAFPIKYLGLHLHSDNLRREDLQPLVDNMLSRIAGWRGRLISFLGEITLIKYFLASIPIYMLSFFQVS